MKKVISFLCIFCLILTNLPLGHSVLRVKNIATPEPQNTPMPSIEYEKNKMDFSSLSLEELLQINQLLQSAIFEKALQYEGITLYPGIYEVGKDIPPGDYRVEYAEKDYSVLFYVYPDMEKAQKKSLIRESYIMAPASNSEIIGKISLVEGNVIVFSGSCVILSKYKGIW